ncbi:hypothetical protein Godav_009965, partial [Gossypium davidsonii]|nr:hypothetical protein [Gossypium davidsonii]MBA0660234.1 hypothetical protein [Gossypium klotzschianum]
ARFGRLEEPTIIPIVKEFYLALKQREATKPLYDIRSVVKVKGVNVPVIEMSICQLYDTPHYCRDYLYKIDMMDFKNIDTEEILRFLNKWM